MGKPEWCELRRDDESGENVQIDPRSVVVGDRVQVALKDEVTFGSQKQRIIAPYAEFVVVSEGDCVSGETICPECVETWCWDYLIRRVDKFQHGDVNTYWRYGCRCPKCRFSHKNWKNARVGKPEANFVPAWGRFPALYVGDDGNYASCPDSR